MARTYSQRFCSRACSDAFYMEERRVALAKLREPTNTYHDRQEEALSPGGRFAAQEPKLDWHGQPPAIWSDDPSGVEPPIDGTDEASVGWGVAEEPLNGARLEHD